MWNFNITNGRYAGGIRNSVAQPTKKHGGNQTARPTEFMSMSDLDIHTWALTSNTGFHALLCPIALSVT